MAPRWDIKSVDEYVEVALQRLRNPAEPATGIAIALILIGIFGFVVFVMVAVVSRSWGYSFSGMFFALLLAGLGIWQLVRPR